jgi:hypothetical protein
MKSHSELSAHYGVGLPSAMRYDNEITELMFCAETGKLVGWRVVDHMTTLLRISVSSSPWDSSCFVSRYFNYFVFRFLVKIMGLKTFAQTFQQVSTAVELW